MSLCLASPVFARRATWLIAAACRLGRRPMVLLPALFCVEVAAAIEAVGLRYRCYDVPPDLSNPWPEMMAALEGLEGKVGVVLTLHPFGLRWPLRGPLPCGETLLLEDACHALRSAWHGDGIGGGEGDLVVYSPRKELGWGEGGVAGGVRARELGLSPAPAVAARWAGSDLGLAARQGRRVTEACCAALGEWLPPVGSGDVLLALPLLSPRRDQVIARLRCHGIGAWRWRVPLKGSGPSQTPGAWSLRRRLLLVPLPAAPGPELGRLLERVAREPLQPWPAAAGAAGLLALDGAAARPGRSEPGPLPGEAPGMRSRRFGGSVK